MNWFWRLMYKPRRIITKINDVTFEVEYNRSPFWAYEKPGLLLFLKDKLMWWHGQVWEVFPNGGRCGFGTNCIHALFPRKTMMRFLEAESKRVYDICYKKK